MATDEDVYRQSGFSLLEVLIALTIFSVGILAVAGMQGVGLKTMGAASLETRRSISAANQIEATLSKPYDDSLLVDTDHEFAPASPDHGPFEMVDGLATIEWEVEDDFPVAGTKRIAVTIRPILKRGSRPLSTFEYVKAKDY